MKAVINIIILFIALQAFAQKENRYIRQGNEAYNSGEYGNSEVAYQKALEMNPNSYEANFNLADAFYKQSKYDDAIKQYSSLLENEKDKSKLAEINYNIGNAHFRKAEELLGKQKMQEAIKELNSSIDAYKKSIINNPADKQAKYNLSMAQYLKKELEKMKNQNQNKQNKNKNNQNQNQNGDQNKNNDNQNNQNQNQDKNKSNEQDSDQDGIPDKVEKGDNDKKPRDTDKDGQPDYKDQDSDNDGIPDEQEAGVDPEHPKDTDKDGLPDYRDTDSDNDGTPDAMDPDQQQQQNNQISREDAMRLLEAIANDEKNVQEKLKKKKGKAVKVKSGKDW